jgi:regulator of protease activity HflC (stomatin/prohibitin superfamily)
MNQTLLRNPLYLGVAAIGALILLSMSVTVVPETQQAIISSYGKVDRVVNAYRKGEVFGDTRAVAAFLGRADPADRQARTQSRWNSRSATDDNSGCVSGLPGPTDVPDYPHRIVCNADRAAATRQAHLRPC